MTGSRGKKNQKAGTRAAAAQAVDQVLTAGRSLDVALSHVIDERLEARDQALIRALSFGALRWHHRHRLIINELLSKPLRARDQILEALLSVGLFQLLDTRQPGYASVSATVEATRELKKPQAAGLVNAMLRRFLREKDALLQRVLNQDEGRHAHPQWLIDQLNADWGDQAADIMACAQKPPPMWLRVNAHRATSERYLQQLDAVGIAASAEANLSGAVLLEKPVSVQTLPGFDEGVASVQDAAAQLAALLLDMKPGMRVLDACAAPGGKTGHILESVGGQAQLTAVDMDPLRNERVKDNVQRLGYTAEIVTADILQWAEDQALHGTFDRILIDAPCSATGVIRRHPDIKFLRRPTDIEALAARQQKILQALWPLLRPGGRLVYATCSVLRAENQDVISAFLAAPDAHEIPAPECTMQLFSTPAEGPGHQLLPGPANTDGFYYALMGKRV